MDTTLLTFKAICIVEFFSQVQVLKLGCQMWVAHPSVLKEKLRVVSSLPTVRHHTMARLCLSLSYLLQCGVLSLSSKYRNHSGSFWLSFRDYCSLRVGGASGKEPTCQCRRRKRHRFNPWVRKTPSRYRGHGNPLQYSCLENPMDREVWWTKGHRVAKSWTWLKRLSTQITQSFFCFIHTKTNPKHFLYNWSKHNSIYAMN